MKFKKIMAWLIASAMAMSAMAIATAAEEEAGDAEGDAPAADGEGETEGEGEGEAAGDGSYVAAITFQTTTYIFRDTLAQSKCYVWDDEIGGPAQVEGSKTVDAEIKGNGTYVVELEGIEDSGWNMLKIDTNISSDDFPDINLIVKAIVLDGVSVEFNADDVAVDVSQNMSSNDYSDYEFTALRAARVQLINGYDGIAAIENKTYKSIKVLFEVAGMGYDAEGLPEISVDDLVGSGAGDSSGDSDSSGDKEDEGTTTTAATTTSAASSSSSSCGGSNATIVLGVLALAAVVIGLIKKSV